HVPVLARPVARRDGSTRAAGAAFGESSKCRCWQENWRSPLVGLDDSYAGRARRSDTESLVRWQDLWREHHGAATRATAGDWRLTTVRTAGTVLRKCRTA